MKQVGLTYFSDTFITSLGLLIFLVFFIGMLIWVHRRSSTELYQYLEQLPLHEGSDK